MKLKIEKPGSKTYLEYEAVDNPKGAIIICPGGGYTFLSDRESEPVAKKFAENGWQAFVLNYSLELKPLLTSPLDDIAWATKYIRRNYKELGLKNQFIGLCGFSAGGHLAASLGVFWNNKDIFPNYSDRNLQRPDVLILCYPVISSGQYTHTDSMSQLMGEDFNSHQLNSLFSLEKNISEDTPPVFIWHTVGDKDVPVENTLLFVNGLAKAKVSFEAHIYPFGEHGLSLATKDVEQIEKNRLADSHVASWFNLCIQWLDIMVKK